MAAKLHQFGNVHTIKGACAPPGLVFNEKVSRKRKNLFRLVNLFAEFDNFYGKLAIFGISNGNFTQCQA